MLKEYDDVKKKKKKKKKNKSNSNYKYVRYNQKNSISFVSAQ